MILAMNLSNFGPRLEANNLDHETLILPFLRCVKNFFPDSMRQDFTRTIASVRQSLEQQNETSPLLPTREVQAIFTNGKQILATQDGKSSIAKASVNPLILLLSFDHGVTTSTQYTPMASPRVNGRALDSDHVDSLCSTVALQQANILAQEDYGISPFYVVSGESKEMHSVVSGDSKETHSEKEVEMEEGSSKGDEKEKEIEDETGTNKKQLKDSEKELEMQEGSGKGDDKEEEIEDDSGTNKKNSKESDGENKVEMQEVSGEGDNKEEEMGVDSGADKKENDEDADKKKNEESPINYKCILNRDRHSPEGDVVGKKADCLTPERLRSIYHTVSFSLVNTGDSLFTSYAVRYTR
jgi:hypothetical protein